MMPSTRGQERPLRQRRRQRALCIGLLLKGDRPARRREALASIVFLRGVNVGGHKAFRPSTLVRELAALRVASVGAAGTFVVRAQASPTQVRARFLKALPFEARVIVCPARDLAELVVADPFSASSADAADGKFISVLEAPPRRPPPLPLYAPAGEDWQVGVIAVRGRFVASLLRRVGRSLLYPNEVVEKHFGVAATTRGWQTILKVCETLKTDAGRPKDRQKLRSSRSRSR
ncbi:MAG: DUF1697 domain-containing protein [Thermoanaerobaculia bacterium]